MMYCSSNNIEKRKEPRFRLSILASIIPQANITSGRAFAAEIEDISPHGINFSTKNYLQSGQDVEVCYLHSENGRQIRLFGRIKWQMIKNEKYKLGIELYHRNNADLTLKQPCLAGSHLEPAINLNSLLSNPGPNHGSIEEKTAYPATFPNELFWGLFLKTFQKEFEKNLIHLSADYFLSSAYLEKILHNLSLNTVSHELATEIESTLNLLRKANTGFLKLTNIFKFMLEESITNNWETQKNSLQKIDLNRLLEDRIDSFKQKLNCLTIPEQNQFFRKEAKVKQIIGSTWKINIGLDLLLLHSYQMLLVKNAKMIEIDLKDHQGIIQMEFKNDGSGIFSGEHAQFVLKLNQSNFGKMNFSDISQLAWLQYTLYFFIEFNPAIIVKSNSGNNLITLCLNINKFK